jgi:hypothetical protein
MVASMRMPAPSAVAMILTSSSGTEAIEAKARNRIRAALVTGGGDAPDRLRPVALLPDEHQQPVGGPDRQQVEHDRLEGQQHRPERPGQEHEGGGGDRGPQQREAAVQAAGGVDGQGAAAPDPGPRQRCSVARS